MPLIPAAIRGTDELRKLGPLRVVYGEPIRLDDLDGRDDREAAQEATDRLMVEIARLEQRRSERSWPLLAARRRRLVRPPRVPRAAEADSPRRGRPANMIVGFANMLVGLWELEQPRAVLVAFDSLETPTYRHEALPAYQSGREFPEDLLEQLNMLPDLVRALSFAVAKAPGYEADDFLGAIVKKEEKARRRVLVATSDRDLFQLASERTTILQPTRGVSEITRVGPDEVRERYGVEPKQVPDFIALRGDPSTASRVRRASVRRRRRRCSRSTGRSKPRSRRDAFPRRRRNSVSIAESRRWTPPLLFLLEDQTPAWAEASALADRWGLNQLSQRLAARA